MIHKKLKGMAKGIKSAKGNPKKTVAAIKKAAKKGKKGA